MNAFGRSVPYYGSLSEALVSLISQRSASLSFKPRTNGYYESCRGSMLQQPFVGSKRNKSVINVHSFMIHELKNDNPFHWS